MILRRGGPKANEGRGCETVGYAIREACDGYINIDANVAFIPTNVDGNYRKERR